MPRCSLLNKQQRLNKYSNNTLPLKENDRAVCLIIQLFTEIP
ncbi:hypothetical protein PFLA_a4188 [Pseudoalteromonas flavipulchra NCIMB 2033 = ATCC BAA-314]|nr:hypothetical protein [Pseudoalteromonas flavipulchra NCIMB 2033 = ATCC BAA-314]